jgi:regulator of replication initiation timing
MQADLAVLKTDQASMRADMQALRSDMQADMQALRGAMQTDMQALRSDMNAIKEDQVTTRAEIQALRTDVDTVRGKIDAGPDMHFLQAAAQRQISEAREAREHRRYIEIKLNEIYGSMATSAEIGKLREEVAQSIDRENELDLRVSAIEYRLGIKNPLAPTE